MTVTTRSAKDPGRGVWLAIIIISAVMSGVLAGVVVWLAGAPSAPALCAGGAAFLGFASLGIAAHRFMAP